MSYKDILKKLKQPHVITFIATIAAQLLVRYGIVVDNQSVEEVITNIVNVATIVSGIVVAHKSDKNSII